MNPIKITILLIATSCFSIFGQGENSGFSYTLECQIINKQKEPLVNAYIEHGGNDGSSQTYYANEKGLFSFPMHTKKDLAIVYCDGYIPKSMTGKMEDNSVIILDKLTQESVLSRHIVKNNKKNSDKIGEFYNKGIQRYLKTEGEALLSYTIDKEGNIRDINVNGSNANIQKEALEAMKHFPKLEPIRLYNNPVNVKVENDRIFFPAR